MRFIRIETALVFIALSAMIGIHTGSVISTSAYQHQTMMEQDKRAATDNALSPQEFRHMRIFARIFWGESGLRACVTGDRDKPRLAFGPAQYQKRTFNEFKEEAGLPWLEWKNPEHQIILTWWAIKNGKEHHWTVVKEVDF